MKRASLQISKDQLSSFEVMARVIGLSPKQQDVLLAFYRYDNQVAASTQARKYVAEELGFGNPGTLNVYVKTLKDMGALVKGEEGFTYAKIIHACMDVESININLV